MNLLDGALGLFQDAEPPYTPLGLAPYETPKQLLVLDGKSEYNKSLETIDTSIDRYKTRRDRPDLPYHVENAARHILYGALAEQAMRNLIPEDSPAKDPARQAQNYPDKTLEVMEANEGLRAVEIARLTHFGVFNVGRRIHKPLEKIVFANPNLATKAVNEWIEPEVNFRPEEGVLSVEFEEVKWTHFRGAMATHAFFLVIIDMQNTQAEKLFLRPAQKLLKPGNHPAAVKKIEQSALELVQNGFDPKHPITYPSSSRYVALHPARLDTIVDERHRKINPNL